MLAEVCAVRRAAPASIASDGFERTGAASEPPGLRAGAMGSSDGVARESGADGAAARGGDAGSSVGTGRACAFAPALGRAELSDGPARGESSDGPGRGEASGAPRRGESSDGVGRGGGGGSSVGSMPRDAGAAAAGGAGSGAGSAPPAFALSRSFAACSSALISRLTAVRGCRSTERRPPAAGSAGRTSAHRFRARDWSRQWAAEK